MQQLMIMGNVEFVEIDQCAYGQPWRNRTGLCFGNCNTVDVQGIAKRRHRDRHADQRVS